MYQHCLPSSRQSRDDTDCTCTFNYMCIKIHDKLKTYIFIVEILRRGYFPPGDEGSFVHTVHAGGLTLQQGQQV